MTPNVPLTSWAPDSDLTTPGVLSDVRNLVPTRRGYAPEYSLVNAVAYASALSGESLGVGTVQLDNGNVIPLVGTADGIFSLAGGSITDRSRAAPYVARSQQLAYWRFSTFRNVTYAINLDNTLQVSASISTTDFSDVAGGPKAFTMAVQRNFLLVANIKDGTYAGAASWLCSAQENPLDWTPDVATGSASGQLTATPGAIVRLISFGDYVVAFKERSMYRGTFVGFSANTWAWPVVSRNVGLIGHDAVCDAEGVLYWLAEDGFYRWSGGPVERIASAPMEWLLATAQGYPFLVSAQAMWDPVRRVVRWTMSIPGAEFGAYVLSYHPDTDRWGRSIMEVRGGILLPGESPPSVASAAPQLRSLVHGWIGYDGRIKVQAGAPLASTFTTGDIGDDDQYIDLSRLRVRFNQTPANSTATLFSREQLGDPLNFVAVAPRRDGKYDFAHSNRWHRIRFAQEGMYEVTGVSVAAVKAGTR